MGVLEDLLSFVDTLSEESEQPTMGYDEDYLNEKIAKASKSWKGVDVDKFMDEVRGREPDKSLEEAADKHIRMVADAAGHPGWDWTTQDIADAFIAGAKWQEEQLMKNAKDGWIDEECVIVLNDGTRIDLQPDCEKKPAFEFEYAQDVRVIVLPKED